MKNIWLIYDSATSEPLLEFLQGSAKTQQDVCLRCVNCETGLDAGLRFGAEDVIIFCPGEWDVHGSEDLLTAMVLAVTGGGRLLICGAASRARASHELHLMMGARFLRSHPCGQIEVFSNDGDAPDEIWDAPDMFERSVFDNATALVSMQIGAQRYPTVWQRPWFRGRVACVSTALTPSAAAYYRPVVDRLLASMLKGG